MSHIRNYFEQYRYTGRFSVRDGRVFIRQDARPGSGPAALSPLPEPCGTWIRVTGSRFSDGVHCPDLDAAFGADEDFEGEVWILSPPPDLCTLCDDIDAYTARHPDGLLSERFGEYSRRNACTCWQQQFAPRLNEWRRMFV